MSRREPGVDMRFWAQRGGKRVFINKKFGLLAPRRLNDSLRVLHYVARYSHWLREHGCEARFPVREDLYRAVLEGEELDGPMDYLEFGVFKGRSMRWWLEHVRHPDARFVGFDSFHGLPEDWGAVLQGDLDARGKIPDIQDSRCSFEVGLFQDTLLGFMSRVPLDRRKVIHMDADLYSSTLYVLSTLAPRLRAGDVFIFDELGGLRTSVHEFRAVDDFLTAFPIKYQILGVTRLYRQVAMRIL